MQVYPQPQDDTDRRLIEIPFNLKEQKQFNKYQAESIETTQKDQLSQQQKKGLLSSDQKSKVSIRVRSDRNGQPILKHSKAHQICFSNDLCQYHYVECWKDYNATDIQEEEKENCCPFCTIF